MDRVVSSVDMMLGKVVVGSNVVADDVLVGVVCVCVELVAVVVVVVITEVLGYIMPRAIIVLMHTHINNTPKPNVVFGYLKPTLLIQIIKGYFDV